MGFFSCLFFLTGRLGRCNHRLGATVRVAKGRHQSGCEHVEHELRYLRRGSGHIWFHDSKDHLRGMSLRNELVNPGQVGGNMTVLELPL